MKTLLAAELYIQNPEWHHIMWNPVSRSMITNRVLIAEAQLLRLSGQPLRSRSSGRKLDELLLSAGSR